MIAVKSQQERVRGERGGGSGRGAEAGWRGWGGVGATCIRAPPKEPAPKHSKVGCKKSRADASSTKPSASTSVGPGVSHPVLCFRKNPSHAQTIWAPWRFSAHERNYVTVRANRTVCSTAKEVTAPSWQLPGTRILRRPDARLYQEH